MKNNPKNIIFTLVCILFFIHISYGQPIFHWVETENDTVSKYGKFEVRADISGNYYNPYDFNQVIVFCYFISPSGVLHSSNGFFYQDYTMAQPDVLVPNGDPHWRVRFAPDEPGNWTYEVVCLDITSYNAYPVQPFYCEDSSDPGYISITQNQKLVFDNGEPFFGIGTNLAWDEWANGFTTYLSWLDQLADNGANFAKLTMAPWWLELEWTETGIGNYDARQNRAWAMDRVIDKMDEEDIYLQLHFLIHDELRTSITPGWSQNPYNSANGGPCSEPQDFLVNQGARDLFKRKIRYIYARWGYSTQVQSWEILSEADMISPWNSFKTQTMDWCNEMAVYTASIDKQNRPVSSGFAIPQNHPGLWNNNATTFTQLHLYDLIPDLEIKNYNFTRWYLETYNKPTVIGEFALAHTPEVVTQTDPEGITFHNCIWSSAFSGALATSMSWWWNNYLIPQGLLTHFQAIENFISQVGLPDDNLHPQVLHTTSDYNEMITIDPDFGNSLEKAPENYFIIDPSGYLKPLELNLGEVLYGYFFNSSRNPPTFKVNYTKPGEFTVRTGDVATLSKIRISLNGVGIFEQNASSNSNYTISVPVGVHEIKVANVGNGYLDIREYRLLNYSPRLRAFSMRDQKNAIGWIQNKQYNYEYINSNGQPQPLTGGKIHFDDFDPGLYSLDWYVEDGSYESSVSVLNNGDKMIVDAPEIVWDGAFELKFISPFVVGFAADVTTGDAPLSVQFTDQSFVGGVNVDSRQWDFGDGNYSTQQNPVHTYQLPGVYDVTLTLSSGSYTDSLTKENYITAVQALVADFAASDTSVLVGELVYFTDLSLGNPTSWFWTFGDNTISNFKNPAHLYTQPGFYSVSLFIQKGGKSDLIIKNNHIEVYNTLVANFESDKTICVKGDAVQFNDLSTGSPNFWMWDFGDGETAVAQNPVHIYEETGTYSIGLKVIANWREDSIVKENLITVVDPLIANFEAGKTFVYTGENIQFSDLSIGTPLTWNWDFGDGNVSQIQHPVHSYQQKGAYTVKLKITNQYLEDSLEINNYITVAVPLVADFIGQPKNVLTGQNVQFNDLSTGSPTFWIWDFGDTTNATSPNPTHKYWFPGNYQVSMTVFAGDSSDVKIKDNYIHVFDSLIADFYALSTEVFVGEPVQFFDDSRGSQLQWAWDFGDGHFSQLQNPLNIYAEEGSYSVRLKIFNNYFADSVTKENYITVLEPLIAGFTADTTKVLVGQEIQFTDLSIGEPTFRLWDFGDNSVTFNQNPVHFYAQTGNYSVSLEITRAGLSDIEIKEDYIEVRDTLIADFYAVSTEVRAGTPVQFIDISRGEPNRWFWDFGIPKINPAQNPLYTYKNPGLYSVQLVVKNDFDTDTISKQNYITVLPPLISQDIVLTDGWSGISTYINPLDVAIDELLSPLGPNLLFSMNHSGIYWPSENTNTINNWNPFDGLIVKMAAGDTLRIVGEVYLNDQVEISAGWNILPVVNSCGENTVTMHQKLGDTLILIKEIAGTNVFWPGYGINTLEQLEPGKSYYSLTNFETSYQFRFCDGDADFKASMENQITFNPWNDFRMTPQSHIVAILPGTIQLPAHEGLSIGAFNKNGVCSGLLYIDDFSQTEAYALVAFGHENQSSNISGFADGELMTFKLFGRKSQRNYNLEVTFNSSFPDEGNFSRNGISGISQVEVTGISDEVLPIPGIFIYPNPGKGIFFVDLSILTEPCQIEVLNSRGEMLKPKLSNTNGVIAIDLSGKAKGIYLVRFTSAQFTTSRKIVLR
jgi:PKD repeat protein